MGRIHTALLSVSDKTGIVELGKALQAQQVKILSTGGTAHSLRAAGQPRQSEKLRQPPTLSSPIAHSISPKEPWGCDG